MFTLMLQKSRMLQIQDAKGEAVVAYCEPLATKEMRYPRISRRVNNMAVFGGFWMSPGMIFSKIKKMGENAHQCCLLTYFAMLFMQLEG